MDSSSGKEMLLEAKRRSPDEIEVHVELQAPKLYFPVRGRAAVHVSLGILTVQSRPPFTTESGEVTVMLEPSEHEPVLAVVTRQGVKTPMISTLGRRRFRGGHRRVCDELFEGLFVWFLMPFPSSSMAF